MITTPIGGSTCSKCANGKACSSTGTDGDCTSGIHITFNTFILDAHMHGP